MIAFGRKQTFTSIIIIVNNLLKTLNPAMSGSGGVVVIALILAAITVGCSATNQMNFKTERTSISLGPDDLAKYGIGFLTPSAATGREADKQPLAMSFALQLQEMRPEIRVIPLPAVLTAVNAADLDAEYKQMYRDYLETGILEGSILQDVSEVAEVRYLVQLSLSSFSQRSTGRWGFLGLRILHTEIATLRVFTQIWDAQEGAIAWEGFTEMSMAYDTTKERPVAFAKAAEVAAEKLFCCLPGSTNTDPYPEDE